jgi:ParB family chromosome partitioning protein
MERRLGRGLGSLLAGGSTEEIAVPAAPAAPAAPAQPGSTPQIALDAIEVNPYQPRQVFDPAGVDELVQSIRQHGLLQPIVVRPHGSGYQLISGERRLRAFRILGKSTIPATIREGVTDQELLELALVENVQRKDLDPIERALGFRRMMEQLHLTQEQVADKVGLQRSTVANQLRLLDLPENVRQALAKGLIQMGHARALLGAKSEADQLALLERTVREDLSVRSVEDAVRQGNKPVSSATAHSEEAAAVGKTLTPQAPWVRDLENRMREHLATKVQLKNGPGYRGQIVIDYYQREDLERLMAILAPKPTV